MVLLAPHSEAATIEVIEANENTVADLSKPNSVRFAIKWTNTQPILLKVHLQANDTGPIALGGTVCNGSDDTWDGFHIQLDDAKWKTDEINNGTVIKIITHVHPVYALNHDETAFISYDNHRYQLKYINVTSYLSTMQRGVDIKFSRSLTPPAKLMIGAITDIEHDRISDNSDWLIDIENIKHGDPWALSDLMEGKRLALEPDGSFAIEPGNFFVMRLWPSLSDSPREGQHPGSVADGC